MNDIMALTGQEASRAGTFCLWDETDRKAEVVGDGTVNIGKTLYKRFVIAGLL